MYCPMCFNNPNVDVQNCVEERCAWWIEDFIEGKGDCAIKNISITNSDIASSLESISASVYRRES